MELKDNEIEVDVIGKTGVGKTLIQILIADMLTSHGFNVKLRGGDGDDWDELKATMGSDRIKAVLDKTKEIRVSEVRVISQRELTSDSLPSNANHVGVNVGSPLCPTLHYDDSPGSTY